MQTRMRCLRVFYYLERSKMLKKGLILLLMSTLLTGCMNSVAVNHQAAQSYMQTVQKAKAQGKIDTSSHTAKRIHAVFNRLLPYARAENKTGVKFDWSMNVIRSKELNAWAMPGGKMVVYTGLVERLKLNDAQIATVMGHEMAHALKEHGKAQMNLGIGVGLATGVLKEVIVRKTGVDSSQAVNTISDLVITKPYSRKAETQADSVGLMLMAKAGFNPEEALVLWQKMAQLERKNDAVSQLFSTHPASEERFENLRALMPKAMTLYHQSHH